MPTFIRRPKLYRKRRRFLLSKASTLTAGVASFVSSGPAVINMTATNASGGTPAYTYQWQRNSNGGSYSNLTGIGVTGDTTPTLSDATVTPGTLYGYKLVYTDSVAATATSNAVTAQAYTGGVLGSASSIFQSSVIQGAG